MKPLMEGIRRLAGELSIPILMSYGYAQAESETEMSAAEREFHETLGNLCDVYMELRYAGHDHGRFHGIDGGRYSGDDGRWGDIADQCTSASESSSASGVLPDSGSAEV